MGWGRVPGAPGGCLIPAPATVRVGEACRRAGHDGAATAPEQVTEGRGAGGEDRSGWLGQGALPTGDF